MKVVLTQTLDHVGVLGEVKEVKPGYARNFLFPRRLAVVATDPRAKVLSKEHQAATAVLAQQRALITELAAQWRGQTFTLSARASSDGTLYGSVGVKEIKKLLGRDDLDFEAPTLKSLGTHPIELTFTDGTTLPITVYIEGETRNPKS